MATAGVVDLVRVSACWEATHGQAARRQATHGQAACRRRRRHADADAGADAGAASAAAEGGEASLAVAVITRAVLQEALLSTRPSVSMDDRKRYDELYKSFR